MINYKNFAYVYDQLMNEAPYDKWIDFTKILIDKYKVNPKKIIDIGCGTCNISIPLSKQGYEMVGVDISSEMLAMAKHKMLENNVAFLLIEQDMREFELYDTANLVISYCDSFNYLSDSIGLRDTFTKIYNHLEIDGYFIFDLHSPYKITDIYNGKTYAWNDEDVSVIWIPDVNVDELTVEHDLTFFIKNDSGSYDKFQETHKQKTYEPEIIKDILKETGFEVADVYSDFKLQPVTNTTERIFYVAKKQLF